MTKLELNQEELKSFKKMVKNNIDALQEMYGDLDSDDIYTVLRTYSRLMPMMAMAGAVNKINSNFIKTAITLASNKLPRSTNPDKEVREEQECLQNPPIETHPLFSGRDGDESIEAHKSGVHEAIHELLKTIKEIKSTR